MKAKDLIIHRSMSIAKGAELLAERTNDLMVIKAYMSNRLVEGFKFTEIQQEKVRRYEFAYNQVMSGRYSDMDVVAQMEKHFKIKRGQAIIDLEDCKELFAFLLPFNKAFEVHLSIQNIDVMLQKMNALNDGKAYAALMKERRYWLELLPERDDSEADMFEGHQNIIEFDPALIGAEDVDVAAVLEYINKKRNKKVNVSLFQEVEVVDEGK